MHRILRYTHRKGRPDEADDETPSDESPPGSTTARGFPQPLTSSSAHHRLILQGITNHIQIFLNLITKMPFTNTELTSFFFEREEEKSVLTWLRTLRRSSRSRPRGSSSAKGSQITVGSTAIDDRSRILTSLLRRFCVLERDLKSKTSRTSRTNSRIINEAKN